MSSNDLQNKSEQLTAVTETQSAEPSARRRLLLKGALSAPVIMTLYSGAALARSSNWITTTDDPEEAKIGESEPAEYACAFGNENVDTTLACNNEFQTNDKDDKCDLGDSGELFSVMDDEECEPGILVHASHACSSFFGPDIIKEDGLCTNYSISRD